MERSHIQDRTREAMVRERHPVLVSNDPTEAEFAYAHREHADEHVVRQMHYAGASSLERVADAAEGQGFDTAEEVIGYMRAVAVNLRHGA